MKICNSEEHKESRPVEISAYCAHAFCISNHAPFTRSFTCPPSTLGNLHPEANIAQSTGLENMNYVLYRCLLFQFLPFAQSDQYRVSLTMYVSTVDRNGSGFLEVTGI